MRGDRARSSGIRTAWRIAAIPVVALAVESLNFPLGNLVLDPGLPANPPVYLRVIGLEWGILHIPGIRVLEGMRQHRSFSIDYPGDYFRPYDWLVVFASGFLVTCLLFAMLAGGVRLLQCPRRAAPDLSQ